VTRFNCAENFSDLYISIFRNSWWNNNFEHRSMFDEVITLQGGRLFGTTCCISHYKQWVLNWVTPQSGVNYRSSVLFSKLQYGNFHNARQVTAGQLFSWTSSSFDVISRHVLAQPRLHVLFWLELRCRRSTVVV